MKLINPLTLASLYIGALKLTFAGSINLILLQKAWLPNNRQSVYNTFEGYLNQFTQ